MAACDDSKLEMEESSELGSTEMVDTPCSPCAHQGLEVSADHYCIECDGYVCNTCVQEHKESKFSAMRAHKIKHKEDFEAGQHGAELEPVSERQDRRCGQHPGQDRRCGQHPGNVIDMFCETDEVACCGSCAILNHKECKSVVYIPDMAVNIEKSMEFSNLQHALNKTLEDMKLLQQNRQADKCRITEEREGLLVAKNSLRQQLETLIDDMDRTTEKELEGKHNKIQEGIDRDISEVNESIESLEVALGEITPNESKSEVSLFINMKNGKKKVTDAGKQFSKLSGAIGKEGLNFKFYKILSESFKLFGIFSEDGDSPTPLAALANCRKCMNEAQFWDSLERMQKEHLTKTKTGTLDRPAAKSNMQPAQKAEWGLNWTENDKREPPWCPLQFFSTPENVKPSLKCSDTENPTPFGLHKVCSDKSFDRVQTIGKDTLPEGSISLPTCSDITDKSVSTERAKRDDSFNLSLAPPGANSDKSTASRSGAVTMVKPNNSSATDSFGSAQTTRLNPSQSEKKTNQSDKTGMSFTFAKTVKPTFAISSNSLPTTKCENPKMGFSFAAPCTKSDIHNFQTDKKSGDLSLGWTPPSFSGIAYKTDSASNSDSLKLGFSFDVTPTTNHGKTEKEINPKFDKRVADLSDLTPVTKSNAPTGTKLSTAPVTKYHESKTDTYGLVPSNRHDTNVKQRHPPIMGKTSNGSNLDPAIRHNSGVSYSSVSTTRCDSRKPKFSFGVDPSAKHVKPDKKSHDNVKSRPANKMRPAFTLDSVAGNRSKVASSGLPINTVSATKCDNPKADFPSWSSTITKDDRSSSTSPWENFFKDFKLIDKS